LLAAGDVDVVTGDYLAELTMLILARDKPRDPSLGYARTFVAQFEDCVGLAMERGVRLVVIAGGLNPGGLARRSATIQGTRRTDAQTTRSAAQAAPTSGIVTGTSTNSCGTGTAMTTAHAQPTTTREGRA
jgi:Acyclic terpene utilisation family protein AtuA